MCVAKPGSSPSISQGPEHSQEKLLSIAGGEEPLVQKHQIWPRDGSPESLVLLSTNTIRGAAVAAAAAAIFNSLGPGGNRGTASGLGPDHAALTRGTAHQTGPRSLN